MTQKITRRFIILFVLFGCFPKAALAQSSCDPCTLTGIPHYQMYQVFIGANNITYPVAYVNCGYYSDLNIEANYGTFTFQMSTVNSFASAFPSYVKIFFD